MVVVHHGLFKLGEVGRVPQVPFAVVAEVVLALVVEFQRAGFPRRRGRAMPSQGLLGNDIEPHALDPRGRAGEVAIDHFVVQPNGLELLGRMVAT